MAGTLFRPFRAIRYDFSATSDISKLIAPPYDIISPAKQCELLARHEHNFVRIELPAGDNHARYNRAAQTLRAWLEEGTLVQENAPSLYLLEQEFVTDNRSYRRRGVFGLVKLPENDKNYVLSHEGTLPEPKADRLQLMSHCQAMTSPVMLMHEDSDNHLLELLASVTTTPDAEARDSDGVVHRMWLLPQRDFTSAITFALGLGPFYIADGHHRFETALAYRTQMMQRFPDASPEASFRYILALVNSAQDEGLRIFPTHRLLAGIGRSDKSVLRNCMHHSFQVQEIDSFDISTELQWLQHQSQDRPAFVVYLGDSGAFRLLAKDALFANNSRVVEKLDVSILHHYLIDPALAGVDCATSLDATISHDSQAAGPVARGLRLAYITDAQQAVAAVARNDYEAAFFLRPTRVSEVIAAARAGERMPGKSTYFYPKIPAGLLLSEAGEEHI